MGKLSVVKNVLKKGASSVDSVVTGKESNNLLLLILIVIVWLYLFFNKGAVK